jgi:D-glycero-D-manno-heptose 1,7-bisphosphate phosphatase
MSTSIGPNRSGTARRAVFLDRDGVLVEDSHLLRDPAAVVLLAGVPEALARLRDAGLALIVASNQAVVARGEATLDQVAAVNARIATLISSAQGPALDGWYACPHHPDATLSEYRLVCDCRKPRPGLLHAAASDHRLTLQRSFMIGDRITDIAAGQAAGCTTVLVRTAAHDQPPIVVLDPLPATEPDHSCDDLTQAADWILAHL